MERNRILKLLGVASISTIIAILYFGKNLGMDRTDKILALISCLASYITIWLVAEITGLVKEPTLIGPREPWYKNSLLPWNWSWSDFFQTTGLSKLWPTNWQWPRTLTRNLRNMNAKTIIKIALTVLAIGVTALAYLQWGAKYAIGVFVALILLAIIVSFGSKIASYLSNMFRGNTNNQNNNNADGPVLEFLNEKDERLYYFLVWLEILLVPIIVCVGIFIFSYYTLGWLSIVGLVLTAYMAFRNAGKKLEENPVDEFMMLTLFGRPLAFMRHGGPHMWARFLTKKHSGSVEIIPIVFGKEAAKRGGESTPADEIACNCATKNQSVLYEKEYVKVFDNADYKPTGVTGQQAYDAAKAVGEINDGQVTLKPEFNIVLRIGVFEKRTVGTEIVDFGLENIRNYFKNIPGETAEARKKYIINQLREDIRSSINTELKKYSYSMLCLMITTNGLDKVFKNQIETLIDEQGLGLQIDTLKMTALGASEEVHKAQEELFAAQFKADSVVIKAKGDANATKETALGEKEKLKLEGQGKAKAFKEMAKEELASIANTMIRLKAEANGDEALLAKIVEWEYKLEEMKLLSGSKSIVITNAGGSGDSSGAQTALLIQAINDLKAEITKK